MREREVGRWEGGSGKERVSWENKNPTQDVGNEGPNHMQLRVPHCGHHFRWNSLWGKEPREGCAKMGVGRMRTLPPGPSVELPVGPRTA